MCFAREADARGHANLADPLSWRAKPEDAPRAAQVDSVKPLIDAHRLSETPRPSGEVAKSANSAARAHERDALERLDRTQQDSGADSSALAGDVEHPRRTVREVDVGMAPFEKQRALGRRLATIGVARRIADWISLCLNDAAAEPRVCEIVHNRLADQVARQFGRVHRKLGAPKTPNCQEASFVWRSHGTPNIRQLGSYVPRLKSSPHAAPFVQGWRILPGEMQHQRLERILLATVAVAAVALAGVTLRAQPGQTGLKVFSLAAAEPKPAGTPWPGAALVGGGGDVDEAARFLCEHAHGGELVVLRASGGDAYNPYFHDLCPNNSVTTLLITSADSARDPVALDHVRRANAIFIAGGDQSNYVKFWSGPMQDELNAAISRGVPIGGISAGLAVLGEFAFSARHDTVTSVEALTNPFSAKVTLERAFLSIPALRGIITDSHFSPRQRMGRTVAFLARIEGDGWADPARAIGIDESTAVLVEPSGEATIAGKGSAYFLELAHRPDKCEAGKPLTVKGVRAYKLAVGSGSRFDLKTWTGNGGTNFVIDVVDGELTRSDR